MDDWQLGCSPEGYTALANRYNILQVLNDLKELDKRPLVNNSMDKVSIGLTFFQGRTTDEDNKMVGKLYFTNEHLIFIGVNTGCFNMLIEQNHDVIRDFFVKPSTKKTMLNGIVNKKYINSVERLLGQNRISNLREKDNHLLFKVQMEIIEVSSGMCFSHFQL